MQTEQELEQEKQAIERMKALDAAKPWYARAWNAYWDWRVRFRFSVSALGIAVLIAGFSIIVKACGHG